MSKTLTLGINYDLILKDRLSFEFATFFLVVVAMQSFTELAYSLANGTSHLSLRI